MMTLPRGTKGIVIQADEAGNEWRLDAVSKSDIIPSDKGPMVLVGIKVRDTPWDIDESTPSGRTLTGNVPFKLYVSPAPKLGAFAPNDPSVLQTRLAIVPAAPLPEAPPLPPPTAATSAPKPPPPAADKPPPASARATAAARPPAAPPPPPPPPPPATPAADAEPVLSSAEKVHALLERQVAQQVRIFRAIRALGPYLEVLGAMRDLVAAMPEDEWATLPEWALPILGRLRPSAAPESTPSPAETVADASAPSAEGPPPVVSVTAERIDPMEGAPGVIPTPEETEVQARRDVAAGVIPGDPREIVPGPDSASENVVEIQP